MSQSGEPFFEAFRELQPDVDIVILPPEEQPVPVPSADREEADAAARDTVRTVRTLLQESGVADRPRSDHERWDRQRGDVHVHVARARVDHDDSYSATESLLRLGGVLDGGGWQPEPVDSPAPWLVATSPAGLRADVAVEHSQLVVTVTSAPLRLEDDPA
ncbi:MAG: hypothetical protein JWR55_2311 [Aeromicrobium sp.]|nr:hypothetical protein [Aeromicrobium sp.]